MTGYFDRQLCDVIQAHSFIKTVVFKDEIGSTNDFAKQLCENQRLGHGGLVMANWQVSGKGRFSNTWESPKGKDILMSLVIRPVMPLNNWSMALFPLSLAVRDALAQVVPASSHVQLKWPNDLLMNGKKCAGMLNLALPAQDLLICGIGINVNQMASAESNRCSVAMACGQEMPRWMVLDAVLGAINRRMLAIQTGTWCSDEWNAHAAYLGEWVQFVHGEHHQGLFFGVDPSGGATIQTDSGIQVFANAHCFRPLMPA